MNIHTVNRPLKRIKIRQFFGKEYFIMKRLIKWIMQNKQFAKVEKTVSLKYHLIKHKSFILRPLKNVDMLLQHNKITNLKLSIKKVDNVIIKPGELFSIWKLIGRPTKSKGYVEGMILNNGRISKGVGGGLCQLGNLIYWMVLHTPLTIKERWHHSYDVFPDVNRNIPFGCGATLSYNYIDLQFENKTNWTFQIKLWIEKEYLCGEILCDSEMNLKYEVFETDHCFCNQWWGGYTRHNKINRRITNLSDNSVNEELIAVNNAILMYNPLIEQ